MQLNLKCLEWTNTNKNARLIKSKTKSKQSDLGDSVYLLQITGYKNNNQKLACLSSEQIVNIYDQQNLKLLSQIKSQEPQGKEINEIGFFKQNENMLFSCSDDGKLKCWDLREYFLDMDKNQPPESVCFSCTEDQKREFLCADVNATDNLFCVGTNKLIDDALVYIYDIRFNNKYLHKFSESHSNDVSQVKFDPVKASKFCSGSLDGLVCLYDLEQEQDVRVKSPSEESSEEEEEDPDLMEQVFNSDSCIHKLGYLSSTQTTPDQLFAITYTNDLFVWDLNTHDLVYKHQTKNKNIQNGNLINVMEDQEEDYFFDCFYLRPKVMVICKGDKMGNMKYYSGEEIIFDGNNNKEETESDGTTNRSHRDIIRSSYWNNEYLFTAGEDGFLFKWKLGEKEEELMKKDENKQSQKRELDKDILDESDEDEKDKKETFKDKKRNKKSNNFYSKNKKSRNFKFSNKNSK